MFSSACISTKDLGKAYRIWETPASRLKSPLLEGLARAFPATSAPAKNLRRAAARQFRDFWALRDVSFEVRRGESIGIIGRNGSGKSTLLQVIAGTLQPTVGEVAINGRVAALLELGSGFNPDFTGRENVHLNAAIHGLSPGEIEARFDDIAEFADIGSFIDQPVKTYSSGMQMRLAFAVTAHVDAEIMIIDEALAVGDAFFIQKCMRWLRNFREKGTLLFVTHNAADLTNLCDRGIWLKEGRVEMMGDVKEVSRAYLEQAQENAAGPPVKVRPHAAPAPLTTGKPVPPPQEDDTADQRLAWLNATQFRNDLRPLAFDPKGPDYGARQAEIVGVELVDCAYGKRLAWIVGGEHVTLRITAKAKAELKQPVLGFYLKDRRGQYLFGDNTYFSNVDRSVTVPRGRTVTAEFSFRMPILPAGHYAIAPAIALGTPEDHVQQHWIHEALIIESTNKNASHGLIGIPMRIETHVDAS